MAILDALTSALRERVQSGAAGGTTARLLAVGDGVTVADVVCTAGPEDRPFEEERGSVGLAVVVAGSFRCRAPTGEAMLVPGTLLLGNAGEPYECGHEHGRGDRCIAFQYSPERFAELVTDAGARSGERYWPTPRLPARRELAALVTRAAVRLDRGAAGGWDELATALAVRTITLARGLPPGGRPAPPNAEARVLAAVRRIEREPDGDLTLDTLARRARMSPYHFLRTFARVTGTTPHQLVLRSRLRAAALALVTSNRPVIDIALDAGFGDLANFNRAFRAELGVHPSGWRRLG